jgi:adenylyl cyclase-associated protein
VVQIKGKLNAITLDQCTKCGLVFESVVAACEVVNSRSVQVRAAVQIMEPPLVPLHAYGSM